MVVYNEELLPIPVGLGVDIHRHPANVQDGFCTEIVNMIAEQDSLVTRKGFQRESTVDTREAYSAVSDSTFVRLPNHHNEDWPVAFYTVNNSTCYGIRQFNRDDPSDTDTNPEIAEFSTLGNLSGAAMYLDRIYVFVRGTGFRYIGASDVDWSTPGVTLNDPGTGPGVNIEGLFVFKDRFWGWLNSTIYYTEPPASAGAYPEDWNTSSNFLVINAAQGLGRIHKILPSGNSLFVFTDSGLFTINVSGSPLNWLPRLVDATVTVDNKNCAFEHQGFVYFTTSDGVFVTNGGEVHKISETLEPLFEETDDDIWFKHILVPFEDGIIFCKQKFWVDGNYPSAANRFISDADVYYTRLDFVAWTKFKLCTTSQIVSVLAGFSKMPTKSNWQGSSYLVLAFGTSSVGSSGSITAELVRYNGYQDIVRLVSASAQTAAVTGHFLTKLVRGSMFQLKRAKYAYLNLSADTSLPDNWNVTYAWHTEHQDSLVSGTITSGIEAIKESLVKFIADFQFRHLLVRIGFTLDSGIRKYTFLGLGVVLHTNRREPRRDS